MIGLKIFRGRSNPFCNTSGPNHISAAKILGVTNIITKEDAPSREISRPPHNLFL